MTDQFTLTEYASGKLAAKAWAAQNGVVGRKGGWLYTASGKPVCQGWDSLVAVLTRRGVLVDVDGEKLATRSDVPKNRNDKWAGMRRNVFDGKPVALRSVAHSNAGGSGLPVFDALVRETFAR